MNKTLLLILVDFLLLTILSMTKWDEEQSERKSTSQTPEDASGVAALGIMDQDLLDTLKSSLEEEQSAQQLATEETTRKQEELEAVKAELAQRDELVRDREKSIQGLESTLEKTKEEVASLASEQTMLNEQVVNSRKTISELEKSYQELQLTARQTEEQSRLLQEELERKALEVAEKEKEITEVESEKKSLAEKSQELEIQVRVAQEEKRFLKENVDTLKGQVVEERQEKQKLQEQAGKLAEGVTQLAERSEDLREELRSSIPINANQIFDKYLDQRVEIEYVVQRFARGRVIEETGLTSTVLVSDGEKTVALAHLDQSPFGLNQNTAGFRALSARLIIDEASYPSPKVQFLALDPRMAALPVEGTITDAHQDAVYLTAIDPFKFSEAVLINAKGNYYGEVEFKLDASAPGYVKMQSKIFSRLFGEFSPSTGDLVFSKTGELLGVMVDRSRCVLIDTFLAWENIDLGSGFSNKTLGETIRSLRLRYEALPTVLK